MKLVIMAIINFIIAPWRKSYEEYKEHDLWQKEKWLWRHDKDSTN